MTVRCPRCSTLYRRPTRIPGSATPTFRCARCRHVFGAGPVEEDVAAGPEPSLDDDDAFVFDAEEPAVDQEDTSEEMADAEPAPRGARPERRPDAPPTDEVELPAREATAGNPRSTTRFALRALLTVFAGYAILSIYIYTHADAARELLASLPVLGARMIETRLNPASIQLTNVHGQYQRVKGDQLVFVIVGTATNNSPVPARAIQVEGRIIGAREERQVVFCGAAPRDVQELSLREIALLQTLEPPKDWALQPGEQTNFLIAFASPPTDLREFAAEVVAVQAPARGRSGLPAGPMRDA
ncbi:MAG TPA: hypothetical protein VE911_01850 [Candidatus Nitrosopolaris sp.]|nr:hypothetical protein [Candidatus Nitrosopolaris sp.]